METDELYEFLLSNGWIKGLYKEDLEEGNWYVNLPNHVQCNPDVVMAIICEHLYVNWESDSINRLMYVFESNFSTDEPFITEYLLRTSYENEFFCRSSEIIQMNYELLKNYLKLGHPESDPFSCLDYVHENVRNNRNLMLKLVHDMPNSFKYFVDNYQDDEEIVIVAVSKNGLLLEFASNRLRASEKIVRLALENNKKSILFAAKKFWEFPDAMFYEEYLIQSKR